FRLEHVAGSGEHQRYLLVGDDHHGFEAPQITVGAPILGKLDRGAGELGGILLELAPQPLEQGESVAGGPGKAADHLALAEPAHFLGIGLDDGLADRDLAVAADRHHAALADGENGGAVPEAGLRIVHGSPRAELDLGTRALQFNRTAKRYDRPTALRN